jgi:hypothetical protein
LQEKTSRQALLQYVHAAAHLKREDCPDEMENHQQHQEGMGQKEIKNDTIEKHRAVHQDKKGYLVSFQAILAKRP